MRIVFDELLANARDAIAESDGAIQIVFRPNASANAVEVIVRDNGCGMAPQVLQRASTRSSPTARPDAAAASVCRRAFRIVEGHRGRIWLESHPGEGTTAHVVLPITPSR